MHRMRRRIPRRGGWRWWSPAFCPHSPMFTEQLTGPSLKVAYKDGEPTPAAEAFARKAGVPVDELEKITTPKGEYLAATVQKKGRAASEILAESLPKEIAGIYWAKNMYWRGKSAERFVRPVRWMVSLLDGEVVPVEFAGIRAGHTSEGHRILSSGAIEIGARPITPTSSRKARSVPSSAAARGAHSQGARCCDPHHSRRALARRQAAARYRRQPDGISRR